MRFEHLADHQELIDVLAGWFYNAWGKFDSTLGISSIEDVKRDLRRNCDKNQAVPVTFVVLSDDNKLMGSISLEHADMSTRRNLTPWIANLYVDQAHRKKGVANFMVSSIINYAKARGIQDIFLWTEDTEEMYQKMGAQTIEHTTYEGANVAVMKFCIPSPKL